MNALKAHLKYQREKAHQEFLQKQKEEQEAYEKMTPEEKMAYDKKMRDKQKNIESLLMTYSAIESLGKY